MRRTVRKRCRLRQARRHPVARRITAPRAHGAAASIALLLLAGCAVGPDYHRPNTPVAAHFANAGEPGFVAADAVQKYWIGFQDPILNGLIEDALVHNKDLSIAAANLQAARAAKRLAGFDLYPTATFAGSYSHNQDSQQDLPGVDRYH